MVREILIWPHPVLRKKALPVTKVDGALRALIQDMFETMYAANGVGLAAPQVGVSSRVVVIDPSPGQPDSQPLAMVNPEIVESEGETTYTEGCLSLPGEAEDVERAERVRVRFLDADGAARELVCEGLLAIAVQHETDHLDGKVFVDRLSVFKRGLIRKRMKRLQADRLQQAQDVAG